MGINMGKNNSLNNKLVDHGITFDDVLVVPSYSDVLPNEVCLKTRLTNNISLNIPFVSAAMDTVTEHRLAIALAQLGGVGVIHKNLSIENQAKEVKVVKNFKFEVEEGMNPAYDTQKRLLVGAAVSTGLDTLERVQKLIAVGVDFIVVDSAHGHSQGILKTVKSLRKKYPELEIIAGNIATTAGAKALVEAGANAVKVGIGPGSICTTRVVAGVGVPQISAIANTYEYCQTHNIPFIADGGIKYSGDIVKALGAGANTVMLGSMFAGTEESPGDVIHIDGNSYKTYVGMGSLAAMSRGSSDRYFQKGAKKLVPEGIESMVNYKGPLAEIVFQMLGGLRSGMGYTGSHTIEELRTNTKFVQITNAGLVESHPHDVKMIQAAPNYNK
ncbi:guanosine monophosphate reductase [Mesoplasma syrphidae]|uniref:Guanosine monophosphate reductase n=2 Tax=Mesoplasma syrphidae TaxID=225999 RepID=A0A2K9BYP9_9MOLU|nr:guanosine monophosphate reductase [Mesoplasma syrphidae]